MKTFNYLLCVLAVILLIISVSAMKGKTKISAPQKVRLSKLVIDYTQLADYKALLKEEIEASMAREPGVLTLYAVFEKDRPTHLTILEMYVSEEAYALHVTTPHFLKYKKGTLKMVKELQLIDTEPLIPGLKIK